MCRATGIHIAFLIGSAIAWVPQCMAQKDTVAMRYAATITEADLRAKLNILASDSFGGRETGTEGQRMAAEYIKEQFRSYGILPVPDAGRKGMLPDGYQQRYPLERTHLGGISLKVDGKPYQFMEDYFYFAEHQHKAMEASEVMVLTPVSLGGTQLGGGSKVVMLLEPEGTTTDPRTQAGEAMEAIRKTNTEVLLLVNRDARNMMAYYSPYITDGRMRLLQDDRKAESQVRQVQVIVITPELAQSILDHGRMSLKRAYRTALKKRVIIKVPLQFGYESRNERIDAENVLAYVEGTDKKGEIVAITAHYDHIGMKDGEVYNGADDDGSGTVAVLEMAQAFAKAKAEGHGPRRSMLFMTVSGEEKGLLGSEWYTMHPVFPLDSTVADLNIDMIGRTDTVHGDSSRYVYVIGSRRISTELGGLIEQENATWTHLNLDYTFDADSDPNRFYYRSDHYNFAKHGVPIAFFFNGVHADYHGPYDEVNKIRFDLLRSRTLLVFYTAWALANK